MSENNNAANPAAEPTELESQDLSQPESAEAVPEAAKPADAPSQTSANKKKYKLKVDGEELEEELDLSNEAEIIKRLQLAKVANKRMQESAEHKKQVAEIQEALAEFFEELEKNPLAVLKDPNLKLDLKSIADALTAEQMADAAKSPEQKELEDAKRRIKEFEEREAEERKARETQEKEKLREEAGKQLENDIVQAIEAKNLPKSKILNEKIMSMARFAYSNGIDIDIKELVPLAAESYKAEIKDYLKEIPDEMLEDLVSQDRIKTVRNKYLQSLKKQNVSQVNTQDTGKTSEKQSTEKKIPSSEFWKKMGV